jgi:NAD(P)H-hydrate epimerase
LLPSAIEKAPVRNYLTDASFVKFILKSRKKFDHKGTYGHALIIAGSYGREGAAILAAKACLRAGCGLVTVHTPRCGYEILQIGFPEAMVSIDPHQFCFTEPPNLLPFNAIGVGCGIGVSHNAEAAFGMLLERAHLPLVIDADGLNILASKPDYLPLIPKNAILTPHPKEFDRLFGESENDFARHDLQVKKAHDLGVFIILKGAYTCIACPDGASYFNPTGNPGMATAGSGDALTGILTSLLAQGYEPKEAAILGVYLHGRAGDIALSETGQESLLASDIIQYLGKAFMGLRH